MPSFHGDQSNSTVQAYMSTDTPALPLAEDPYAPAESAFRILLADALAAARITPQGIDHHQRRAPLCDMRYDEQFIRLPSFSTAAEHISRIPEVQQQYGPAETTRLMLQILYAYFELADDLMFNDGSFGATWSRFRDELSTPHWRHVGMTVLQNFESDLGRIEIADGVTICRRTAEHVRGAIFKEHLEWLVEDCIAGALGSHVLIVEFREPKTPENVIRTDSYHTYLLLQRALLVIRLLKPGNLRTARFHWIRPSLMPIRESGRRSSGSAEWQPGARCRVLHDDQSALRDIYTLLNKFETSHAQAWKNVSTALRWFTAIFENVWNNPLDSVIDAVIAIEALLGTDQEITYRLSTRVAGLLADTDDERVAIFRMMKLIYETRSTIVHGGELKDKHRAVLNDLTPLTDIVRRLLLGFLRLATGRSSFNNRSRLLNDIDGMLLHSKSRDELRQAMGLALPPVSADQ